MKEGEPDKYTDEVGKEGEPDKYTDEVVKEGEPGAEPLAQQQRHRRAVNRSLRSKHLEKSINLLFQISD